MKRNILIKNTTFVQYYVFNKASGKIKVVECSWQQQEMFSSDSCSHALPLQIHCMRGHRTLILISLTFFSATHHNVLTTQLENQLCQLCDLLFVHFQANWPFNDLNVSSARRCSTSRCQPTPCEPSWLTSAAAYFCQATRLMEVTPDLCLLHWNNTKHTHTRQINDSYKKNSKRDFIIQLGGASFPCLQQSGLSSA